RAMKSPISRRASTEQHRPSPTHGWRCAATEDQRLTGVLTDALTERPTMMATTVLTLIVIIMIAMRMTTSRARESVHSGASERRVASGATRRCGTGSGEAYARVAVGRSRGTGSEASGIGPLFGGRGVVDELIPAV